MPLELHGTYWTIKEIADVLNLEYSGVFKRIMADGFEHKLINIATRTYLMPEDAALEFLEHMDSRSYTADYVARRSGVTVSELKTAADMGFPHREVDGKLRFSPEHLPIFQAAATRIPRKEDCEKGARGEALGKLALRILEQLAEEDADVSV